MKPHITFFKVICQIPRSHMQKNLSEAGQIWGFLAFWGERKGRSSWNLACRSILTTFQNYLDFFHNLLNFLILAAFWLKNAWEEWPGICHANVSWPHSQLIRFWSWSVDFFILVASLHRETGQNCGFMAYSGKLIGGMVWSLTCWCILTTFRIGWPDNGLKL